MPQDIIMYIISYESDRSYPTFTVHKIIVNLLISLFYWRMYESLYFIKLVFSTRFPTPRFYLVPYPQLFHCSLIGGILSMIGSVSTSAVGLTFTFYCDFCYWKIFSQTLLSLHKTNCHWIFIWKCGLLVEKFYY